MWKKDILILLSENRNRFLKPWFVLNLNYFLTIHMNNYTNNLMILCQKNFWWVFGPTLIFIPKNLEFISGLKYIFVIEMFNKGLHVVIELSKSKSVVNWII
jgi:hypothetical protein